MSQAAHPYAGNPPAANPYAGQREPLPTGVRRAGFRQDFAELDGVVLSYLRGPRNGPPLLLLPAQVATWTTYRPVLGALARDFEVFVVGHFFAGFSHEHALRRANCPLLLLHGRWRRLPEHGLVGAMDDDDANRVRRLAPQTVYRRIDANHVLHRYRPRHYVQAIRTFVVAPVYRPAANTTGMAT